MSIFIISWSWFWWLQAVQTSVWVHGAVLRLLHCSLSTSFPCKILHTGERVSDMIWVFSVFRLVWHGQLFSIDALLCDAHFTLFRPPAPILRLGRFTRWMDFWKNPFFILRYAFWPLNNAREERKHQIFKLPFCSLTPLSGLTFSSATLSWTSDHSWKIPEIAGWLLLLLFCSRCLLRGKVGLAGLIPNSHISTPPPAWLLSFPHYLLFL